MKSSEMGIEMSTLKVLKEYLVGKGGYLLNTDNNGKTVMLYGAWGSGKTHFWLEDITPRLKKENQKNIYISLYGRESISELKFEVLKEAYNLEVKDDIISKSASMLSMIAPSLGEKSLVGGYDKLNKAAKEKQAEEILKSGSIICLDDFERKSSKIDLNDLFGYISQLALDYNCKVIIILNSDVFEGEEANVFKTVKEKTVNKFFYFEPTIEELFNSIYNSEDKYKRLDEYKTEILNAIKETEELNARIYIQVLDNCLEWVDKGYNRVGLKVLVLITMNFILNNFILDYLIPDKVDGGMLGHRHRLRYSIFREYPERIGYLIFDIKSTTIEEFREEISLKNYEKLIENIEMALNGKTKEGQAIYTGAIQEKYFNFLNDKKKEIQAIWKYGYELYYMDTIDKTIYFEISDFVKTGILLKKDKKKS